MTGSLLEEGDILLGIKTEGINGTNYPFVKIMMERKPELYHARMENDKIFLDELMKANWAYTREITALQEKGYLHKAFRIHNTLLNGKSWQGMPEGLGVCIDLSLVPVLPLFQFLFMQDMIGENVFPSHFNMGIGMVAAVAREHWEDAMRVIGRYSECWRIGQVEKNDFHKGETAWSVGKIKWRRGFDKG